MENLKHNVVLDENTKVNKNLELMRWLYEQVKSGYLPWLEVEEMQDLVDKIVTWYTIKYPQNYFFSDATIQSDYLSQNMPLSALKTRLSIKERKFLEGRYRMGKSHNLEENTLTFKIRDDFGIAHQFSAYDTDGILFGNLGIFEPLKKDEKALTLEELHEALSFCPKYDISELAKIVKTHELDIALRAGVFKLVTMTLLESDPVHPETSKARAAKWMEEAGAWYNDQSIARPQNLVEKEDSHLGERRAHRLSEKIHSKTVKNNRTTY